MVSVKVPRRRPFFCKCADSALAGGGVAICVAANELPGVYF